MSKNLETYFDRYEYMAELRPESTPKQHFTEWLWRAHSLGDIGKGDIYALEMLFEIQQTLKQKVLQSTQEAQPAHDALQVSKDKYGNLWVRRGEEDAVAWYSYGRVYTVVNGAESEPRPEDCRRIADAFLALAKHYEESAQ